MFVGYDKVLKFYHGFFQIILNLHDSYDELFFSTYSFSVVSIPFLYSVLYHFQQIIEFLDRHMVPVEELFFKIVKISIQHEKFTLFKSKIVDRVYPHTPYIKIKL